MKVNDLRFHGEFPEETNSRAASRLADEKRTPAEDYVDWKKPRGRRETSAKSGEARDGCVGGIKLV